MRYSLFGIFAVSHSVYRNNNGIYLYKSHFATSVSMPLCYMLYLAISNMIFDVDDQKAPYFKNLLSL